MIKLPPPSKVIRPILGLAVRGCPFSLQKKIAEKVLPQAFAEALEDGDMDFLEGRSVGLDIEDLGYQMTLTLENQQLRVIPRHTLDHGKPEVIIGGKLDEFIRLAARKEDPDTLFFQRRLSIEGDTELGLELKNLIDSIDMTTLPAWMQHSLNIAERILPNAPAT